MPDPDTAAPAPKSASTTEESPKLDSKGRPLTRKPIKTDGPARVAVRLGVTLLAFGTGFCLTACPTPEVATEAPPSEATGGDEKAADEKAPEGEPAKAEAPTEEAAPVEAKADEKAPETAAK